eukprot:PhM_4_TR653/c0_g1_i1/m.28271
MNYNTVSQLEQSIRTCSGSTCDVHAVALYLEDYIVAAAPATSGREKEVPVALQNAIMSAPNASARWASWCVLDCLLKKVAAVMLKSHDAKAQLVCARDGIMRLLPQLVVRAVPWGGGEGDLVPYLDILGSWFANGVIPRNAMAEIEGNVARHLASLKAKEGQERHMLQQQGAAVAGNGNVVAAFLQSQERKSLVRRQQVRAEDVLATVAHMYDNVTQEMCNHCGAVMPDRDARDRHGRCHFYYRESGRMFLRLYNCGVDNWINHVPDNSSGSGSSGAYVRTMTTTNDRMFVDVIRGRRRDAGGDGDADGHDESTRDRAAKRTKSDAAASSSLSSSVMVIDTPTSVVRCAMCSEEITPVLRQGQWVLTGCVRGNVSGEIAHVACAGCVTQF